MTYNFETFVLTYTGLKNCNDESTRVSSPRGFAWIIYRMP